MPHRANIEAPVHNVAKEGFSKQVDAYEQGRPSYPAAAVDYALDTLQLRTGRKTVLDLAAGTGKLTRLLAEHANLDITAVEPNGAMIEGFRSAAPGVAILQGAAQQLPFPDGSVHAVFVGQGFHWFAHEAALAEIHRVLRPGSGGLCLIWNREDGSNSWAADLLAIFEPLSRGIPQYWTGDWVRVWESEWAQQHYRIPVSDPRSQSRYFKSTMQMSRERLWQRVVSRSYVAMLPADKLQAVKQQFDEVVARHADQFHASATGGAEVADVPQTTEVFIAVAQ